MSFGGSSEKLEKLLNAKNFQNRIINTQRVRLKNDHNCYSKNDPQTFLKNWTMNVTQKLNHNCFSKRNVTQKVIHKWYRKLARKGHSKLIPETFSKIDSQTLLKNWTTNVIQKVKNPYLLMIFYQKLAATSNNLLMLWFNNLCFMPSCRLLSLQKTLTKILT